MKEKDIGREVKMTNTLISRAITAVIKKDGIDEATGTHGFVLGYLLRNPDRDIFQKDIEAHFSICRSSVTSVLTLMEKKGYIKRCSVEHDARLKKIVITDKGRQIHDDIIKNIKSMESRLEQGISPEELEAFYSVLEKVRINAEQIIKEGYDNND